MISFVKLCNQNKNFSRLTGVMSKLLFPILHPMFIMLISPSCTSTCALSTVRLSHVLRLLTAKRVLISRDLSVKPQNNSITYVYHTICIQTLCLMPILYHFQIHEISITVRKRIAVFVR